MNNARTIQTIRKEIKKIVIDQKLGNNIVPDGIVNTNLWKETNPKIVFVLKDTNDQETNLTELLDKPFSGEYRKYIKDEEKRNQQIVKDLRTTWLNIARWSLGINKLLNKQKIVKWIDIRPESDWYKERWLKELKNIAVINIKKTVGKEKSIYSELRDAVKNYGALTWEQINLYKSNFVIFCGVSEVFNTYYLKENQKINWEKTEKGYSYFKNDNTIFIQFWHPNAYFPHNMMLYTLMDIVKETIEE